MLTPLEETRITLLEKLVAELEATLKDFSSKEGMGDMIDPVQEGLLDLSHRITALQNMLTLLKQMLDRH